MLRDVLAAAVDNPSAALPDLLRATPHWGAATRAVAVHPGLHVPARAALHAWLGASGNIRVWQLLVHLVQVAVADAAEKKEDGSSELPSELEALYPPALHHAAAVVLLGCSGREGRSGGNGLRQRHQLETAVRALDRALDTSNDMHGASMPFDGIIEDDAVVTAEDVWHLALDGPAVLHTALAAVPWAALEAAALAPVDPTYQPMGTPADVSLEESEGLGAAAAWLGVLMWPHGAGEQRVLGDLLCPQRRGRVDAAAVRPGMRSLMAWREAWG